MNGPTLPFPLPELVFGGLADRWNVFNAIQLHPDTRRFALECIGANRYQLETRLVNFEMSGHKNAVTGFTGHCRFVILRPDRYWQGLAHSLAAYGFYAGVGRHTTIGLGRVRLREDRQGVVETPPDL